MENIDTYVLDLTPTQASELQEIIEKLTVRGLVAGFSLLPARASRAQLLWLPQAYGDWVRSGGLLTLPSDTIEQEAITADSEAELQNRLNTMLSA